MKRKCKQCGAHDIVFKAQVDITKARGGDHIVDQTGNSFLLKRDAERMLGTQKPYPYYLCIAGLGGIKRHVFSVEKDGQISEGGRIVDVLRDGKSIFS